MTNEVNCWRCSKHYNNFTYVLNIIIELKKKKISSSFQNILERLNVGDEANFITESLLREILEYASLSHYVCTSTYKNNISYRINDKEIDVECASCGDKLIPYTDNCFSKCSIDYVDYSNVQPTLSTKHVAMETKDSDYNWHHVKHTSHFNHRNSINKINDIPLQNRFKGLVNEEIITDTNKLFNDKRSSENFTSQNISTFNHNKKRPDVVTNKFCDNDIISRGENVVNKTRPGNSSYADINKHGKKICLLGSSIIQRIKMHDFNSQLYDGKAIKRSFSGCTAKRMKYYVTEVLEEERPDTIILQIGGNDLSNRNKTEKDILQEIINLVNMCRNGGVNDIIVSSITTRPAFQTKLEEVNRLLQVNAGTHNYIFADNSNIHHNHLWNDKIHLNNEGISLLAKNYLDILHKNPHFYDFY